MRPRAIPLSISIVALAAQSLGLAAPALATTPVVVPFAYTGDQQSWPVPAGVSTVHVIVVGAHGGSPVGSPTATGGFGARVEGDIHVTGGTTLYVEVGGVGFLGGSPGGGFNGGGVGGTNGGVAGYGGGGASDVRPIPMGSPGSATSAIVVAGGGGGGGNDLPGTPGAKGGDAGTAGTDGNNASGGGAGGQGVGGLGGIGSIPGFDGAPGTEAVGGAGGNGNAGGGGGGGGYYGGGGGGASSSGRGGGGGGGSSYTDAVSNLALTTDTTGVASVTITYTPPADNGSVHVQFSVPTSAACLELSTS